MTNLFDLKGKKAVVTGGSSGLGVQFAKALARQGADVAVVARRIEKLEKVRDELKDIGVNSIAVRCDVSKTDDIANAVDEIIKHFGTIDILVNNAGLGLMEPAHTQSDETWEKMMDVNVNGVYYFAREVVDKVMLEKKYGRIINIGSIHSTVAMLGSPISAYCTTKGAVEMMTRALANEWAEYNITVNAVGPGYFPSEMTKDVLEDEEFLQAIKTFCPMKRTGKDGELDGIIVYLASDASSYTTGQLIQIDGGWTTV